MAEVTPAAELAEVEVDVEGEEEKKKEDREEDDGEENEGAGELPRPTSLRKPSGDGRYNSAMWPETTRVQPVKNSSRSLGSNRALAGRRTSNVFYRRKVPASELHKYLEWGDILLFCGKKVGACCIRCFTNSPYDHVAIVVPEYRGMGATQGGLHVFEATGSKGVQTCPIKMFANWTHWYNDNFHEICIRKMIVPGGRNGPAGQAARRKLIAFTKKNVKKSYETNFGEIIKAWAGLENEEDDSSFFCSELVAAAWKEMGWLPSGEGTRASNNYLPRDFVGRRARNIKFAKGFGLTKMRRIHFGE
eukprot:g3734.t1